MSLETERTPQDAVLADSLRQHALKAVELTAASGAYLRPVGAWLRRQPLIRFFTSSLVRRILISNLVGLLILLGSLLYLSQHHAWLIDAKVQSLKAQGEIIAAAIAGEARVETDHITLDPDKLPEADRFRIPYRDDGFADLELSIMPERVTPVLRRMIKPSSNIRARVYGRDGTLIVDTAMLLTRGQISRPETHDRAILKTKNFWTKLTRWLIDKQLPVYKEIGTANGMAYNEVRMAAAGSPTAMLLLDTNGDQIVSTAEPIRRMNAVQGVLLLSTRPGEIDRILWEERSLVLTIASLALLATIVASVVLARTVAGPMRQLSEAAERVSHNITARQEIPEFEGRSDEVGQMAVSFRAMTAALYRRIEASEKFAADVAHELKNPLTAARSTAESLSFAKTDEQRAELVSQIKHELQRLNRLITDVSNASRLDAELARQEMRPINITVVVDSIVSIFHDILSSDGRSVALKVEPPPFDGAYVIDGNEGRLGQVITNLIDNAVSFSPENGQVTVSVKRNRNFVEIAVEDEGPGIPDDRLDIIFDRFYTDRPATEQERGKNSGLGLSISREIVRAHGGQIYAENCATQAAGAKGARFVVKLPPAGSATRGGQFGGRRA
jgi:two-component system sensor histidine kinase ChvG